MSQADLERIRGDLDLICEAGGLELPFSWADVWQALALVPAGAGLAVLGGFAALSTVRWAVLAVAVPVFGFALVQRSRYRRSTGRSPARRKEYTLGLVAGFLLVTLAFGFLTWARWRGESTEVLGGMVVAFSGALCVVVALTSPGRRCLLGAAAALLPYGLVVPFCSPRQAIIAGGAAMAFAGAVGAAIQAWQLRNAEGAHEPAAH